MKPRRPSPGYDVDVPPGRRLTLAIATCFLAASVGAGEAPPSKLPPKTPRNGEPFVLPDASPASEPLTAPAGPAHEDWLPGRAWVLVLAGGASLAAAALFAPRSRVHRMLELERVRTRLAADLRRQVYLVFKEAVNNAARHSGCSRARVALARTPHPPRLQLTVEDDGIGFELDGPITGVGLGSLVTRARAMGGTLDLSSVEGGGTAVTLTVLLKPSR